MSKKLIITAICLIVGFTTGIGIGATQIKPVQADILTATVSTCPTPTSEGAYNQLGTDIVTGKPICHFVYSNACPYTEALSASDPLCYKNQSAPIVPPIVTPAPTQIIVTTKTPIKNACND